MNRSSNTSGTVDCQPPAASTPSVEELALETALAAHGIPTPQIRKLVRLAAPQPDEERAIALTRALAQLYLFNPLGTAAGRFFFVGAPGVGKTLAVAKLAAHAAARGRAVRLVTCDTSRGAGIEQLRRFAATLGLGIEVAGDDAALGAWSASADAMTLIDSAGINPYSPSERAALETLATAARAEPILVLAAGGDPADTVETAHVFRDIGCQRFVVTRLDIVQRLGSVLAVPEALGIAFAEGLSATALGQGVETFAADSLAARLLRTKL
jgi:flagellar biosynthesis protein FlhF